MAPVEEQPATYLLDTHVLLWWLFDDPKLSPLARQIIRSPDNTILVSAASGWEIATKHRLGKLPHAGEAVHNLHALLRRARFEVVPITMAHALAAGELPGPHRDPFDRMLIAQGQVEGIAIITADSAFKQYPIEVVW